MNKLNKNLIIGLIVVAVVATAGFLLWGKMDDLKLVSIVKIGEKADESQEEEKIDTSEWKTYRNEKHGFEFKYPDIFSIEDENGGKIFIDEKNKYTFHVKVRNEKLDKNNIDGIYGLVDTEDISDFQLGGMFVYRYKSGDAGCGGNNYRIIIKDNYHLEIFFVSCDGDKFIYENGILQSLKFTK